jgi:hypothetical protein
MWSMQLSGRRGREQGRRRLTRLKAATLTTLTSPKCIAFDGSGGPTAREIAEQSRWFTPGRSSGGEYVDGKVRWNLPRGDHQIRKAYWTSAEAGMACKGLDERCYYVLRYEHAMDDSVFWSLKLHLLEFIIREKQRNYRWPDKVMRAQGRYIGGTWFPTKDVKNKQLYSEEKYLSDLVTMQLIEARDPGRFKRIDSRQPDPKREAMQVTHDTWRRKLSDIYETIFDKYHTWRSIGEEHMNRRLREVA